ECIEQLWIHIRSRHYTPALLFAGLVPHVRPVAVGAHLDDAGLVEVPKVLADRVQVVLDAVGNSWDVRVPRHAAYASSNCSSISRRCGRDSGRTTRYAVM